MTVTPYLFREATPAELETVVNASLSAVLDARLTGIEVDAVQIYPFYTKNIFVAITTDTENASTILNPYVFKTFSAAEDAGATQLARNFIAANPTYFFSPIFAVYRPGVTDPNQSTTVGLIYNTDSAEGYSNWGYGTSGGSSSPGSWSPVTLTNGDADDIELGDVCYISADNTARKAFANGTDAQAAAVVICVNATPIGTGATGSFAWGGNVAGLSGGVAGATGYLDTVAGQIAATPDLTMGEFNTILGTWQSSTIFNFSPEIPIAN